MAWARARAWRLHPRAMLAGGLAALLTAAAVWVAPAAFRGSVHEWAIDTLLTLAAPLRPLTVPAVPVVVVDIDSQALAAAGPWPWPRRHIATLVTAAARSEARAVAIDILFDGPDAKSPASLARRLGEQTGRPDLTALAETLEDGDRLLADALDGVPVALGFALDPHGAADLPAVPFLTSGTVALPGLWRAGGAIPPLPALIPHAAGLGALALPGDDDGLVRRVPLLTGIGGRVHPGLAVEASRLARQASAYRLDGEAGTLGIGGIVVPLPLDGMLRLIPGPADVTVIPASEVLTRSVPDPRLRGAIVIIGGSAPELGGLRPGPGDPLVPSAMLQAAAVGQLARGIAPVPVWFGFTVGVSGVAALCGLGAASMRPLRGTVAVLGFTAMLAGGAVAGAARDWLFDPSVPILLTLSAFATAALFLAAETQLREARIRQRFSQHLAPAVVELIAASPSVLKLAGERREITALFTDVEGFTAMTHAAGPEALVAMLDDYFEGVTQIVIDHGGMIDKLVGDAVHAFFNMPLDLPDHPAKAVACAVAIQAWTEAWRRRGVQAELRFGRTRIGIETGPAVVGDIGVRAKLDYTAHGDTVNAAARFEAANKEIGSSICVGPEAAARCPAETLRPTGTITLRGFDAPVRTFEPWPEGAGAGWRARYLAAVGLAETDPAAAVEGLLGLARERPEDAMPGVLAGRLGKP